MCVCLCVCKVNLYRAKDKPAGFFKKKKGATVVHANALWFVELRSNNNKSTGGGEVLLNEWRSGEPATASPVELHIH